MLFQACGRTPRRYQKYEDLDEWEKANIEADTLAKQALLKYMTQGCPSIDTPITQGD